MDNFTSFQGPPHSPPLPTEDFSLNYEEIKVTYSNKDQSGLRPGKWINFQS